jgi:hypothetical protein
MLEHNRFNSAQHAQQLFPSVSGRVRETFVSHVHRDLCGTARVPAWRDTAGSADTRRESPSRGQIRAAGGEHHNLCTFDTQCPTHRDPNSRSGCWERPGGHPRFAIRPRRARACRSRIARWSRAQLRHARRVGPVSSGAPFANARRVASSTGWRLSDGLLVKDPARPAGQAACPA